MRQFASLIAERSFLTLLATFNLCASCWAGPPAPPNIPSTPVGNAEVSAVTIAAIAAYGFWKSRK